MRPYYTTWDSARFRSIEQILACLVSSLTVKQVLRLGEPLHALENISNALESALLRVVEQILARLASVSP